ncbi:MAG: glucosyltransferase domain-containing protein [Lachnospiraceae bacterium]|nr:glucosyltransferase domain-containing protein [Lachnospiraceae bacterium]
MLKYIEQKKVEWWKEKDVLIAGTIVGILAHIYMMTNKLPNIDDYISIFHYGSGYASGRWLLALIGNSLFRIDGTYSMPFFNGVVFVLMLSLAIMIFLKPFRFKSRWVKRILAGLFLSFPTVTATMGFMFTAPFYGVAVLFMAIAFYILVSYKYGFLLSIFLVCLSLGIYQAYWGLIAGFLLLYLMLLCMDEESKELEIVVLAIKSFVTLLFGVVLYLIVNNIMLGIQGINMSEYQGLSEMGQFELSRIPEILKMAYGWFFGFTTENYLHITWYPYVRVVIAIGYVLTAMFGVQALIHNRKRAFKSIALTVFVAVFPLAVNSIYIMCNNGSFVHTLMCYSVVLVFFIPFIFIDGFKNGKLGKSVASGARYGYLFAVFIVIIFYIRFANIYYLNLELAFYETSHFMETLSTRIQDADNYSTDKPICFYGAYGESVNRNIWELRMVNNMTGTVDVGNVINAPLMRQAYSRVYLGNTFYELGDMSIIDKYEQQIKEMPSYPDDGSIVVMEDVVIVKFSDVD